MKARKAALAGLGSLALLVAVVAGFLAGPVDGFVKNQIERSLREGKQRTLRIEGGLSLTLWPKFGARIGKTSLSEKGSEQTFASLDSARLSVALWPLLSGHVVADGVEVSGLQATVIKRRDGSLNIDDLLSPQDSRPLQIDIAGAKLADARLTWRDENAGTATTVTGIELETGPIHADTGRHAYGIAAASIAGRLADAAARVELAGIEGDADSLRIGRLGVDIDAKAGAAAVKGRLDGPVAADFRKRTVQFAKFAGKFAIAHPRLPMKQVRLPVSGSASLDLARPAATLALAARLDDAGIAGRFDVKRFSPLSLGIDVDIDRLDLDRYLPPSSADNGKLDLSAFNALGVYGTVRIGSLQFARIKAANVRLRLGGKDLS